MTREQKIWRLRRRCGNIGHCDEKTCKIYAKCVNLGYTSFEQLSDEKINEMYNEVFGTQITENLTGVVKEDHERVKTVTDILEEVKQEIMTDEEKRMVEFNNYIDDLNIDGLIKFMNGESDNFEPIPIPKEVDDDNRR